MYIGGDAAAFRSYMRIDLAVVATSLANLASASLAVNRSMETDNEMAPIRCPEREITGAPTDMSLGK